MDIAQLRREGCCQGSRAAHPRGVDTNSDAILKQVSIVETATEMEVDGIVMNPVNWDSVLLSKNAAGDYVASGGPLAAPGPKTLWGRPVAVTLAIAAGTALVGAFKTAAQFFRRGGGRRVEVETLHDALARERARSSELQRRAELLEHALRTAYRFAVTPRRRDD